MWRLPFLFSALLIAGAIFARGVYGRRVIATQGRRPTQMNPDVWGEIAGAQSSTTEARASAAEHGAALRVVALERWKKHDPSAARAREAALRFGLAAPPLTLLVVAFAVPLMKLQIFGALAVVAGMTALAVLFGLLSMGAELRVVAAVAKVARARHLFPRRDDEEAVIACAQAEVWLASLPPILKPLA